MSQNITSVLQCVSKLTSEVQRLGLKLDRLSDDNSKLTTDNSSLRNIVADLTQKVSELSWKLFKPTNQAQDLLIGSSIIRDVYPNKLKDTEVVCKPGGTIDSVKAEVCKQKAGFENITLVVGGNDCHKHPLTRAADIVNSYKELVNVSCERSKKVTVSSICPRLAGETVQEHIEAVNAGLLSMCVDKPNVTFIDNTPSFKLADGGYNDGYYLADGIHITRPAVNKLARNLNLKVHNKAEGACRDQPNQQMNTDTKTKVPSGNRKLAARGRDDQNTDDSAWQIQRRQRHKRQSQGHRDQRMQSYQRSNASSPDDRTCSYCSESGHLKKDCRHGQPVICNLCHTPGHKAKFCEYSY